MNVALPISEIDRLRLDPAFVTAMGTLYAELDAEVAAHAPACTNRGVCCKFEAFGHNLFATAIELAYFLATTDGPLRVPADRSHCPYQQEGQCTARDGRPTGCRIFFCDPTAQDWQPELTERTLTNLADLGTRFGLEYVYLEWTDALRQLGDRNALNTPACGVNRPV